MKPYKIITHSEPRSPSAEAFRILRTNVFCSASEQGIKKILVTSPGPGEGKSTTLANYTVTLVQGGKKVIVVDTDLRKPEQHKLFGLPLRDGLTDHLAGRLPLDAVLKPTFLDNLSVIPAGAIPPNPSEMLEQDAFKDLVAELEQRADFILFDSPPVLAFTDAAVIAGKMDGVILVLKAGINPRTALRAKEALENARANILGTVLNNASCDFDKSYYYYYSNTM